MKRDIMMQNGKIGAPLRRLGRSESGMAAVEFALVAPILLMMIIAVLVYSIYFSAVIGVRQAAAEGARAAMAGMSTSERSSLAIARATAVMSGYTPLIGATAQPTITAAQQGTGLFQVTVRYNITGSAIMRYGGFVPLPAPVIQSFVIVANGSY
jgi:Flp pilus assembly protein TadG